MSEVLRRALSAAGKRGMRLRVSEVNPEIAEISCTRCGWGRGLWDQRIAVYASHPYACECPESDVERPYSGKSPLSGVRVAGRGEGASSERTDALRVNPK